MSKRAHKTSNSVLYLALLCLVYFLVTTNFLSPNANSNSKFDTENTIYIEIKENDRSIISTFRNVNELNALKAKYSLTANLKSGDKLYLDNESVKVGRICGRKSISLGVPIGINSATKNDLSAISGIGAKLAEQIIHYRASVGRIESIDELENIEGIGKKKLDNIKEVSNLD